MSTRKIKLDYFLKRNKVTQENFIKQNKFKTYDELVDFCKKRNLIPEKKENYKAFKQIEEQPIAKTKKQNVKKRSTPRRKVSQTHKKQSIRSSTKKIKNS